jgi:hypothetical protein
VTNTREQIWSSRNYAITALVLGCIFGLLCLQWQLTSGKLPTFDDGMYLVVALAEYKAFWAGGLAGFYRAFMTYDPGKGGLLGILAQPAFFLFGPSAKTAMISFYLLWPLAVWSTFDFASSFGLNLLNLSDRTARVGGILAAFLLAIHPLTQFLTSFYLTEFPLVTFIAIVHASALRYFLTGRVLWTLVLGFGLLGGVLAKVTFPAFVIVAATLVLGRWLTAWNWRDFVVAALFCIAPTLIVAAPFYVTNWRTVVETTRFLTSAETASVYGLGGAWDIAASSKFIWNMLHAYEFLLCVSMATVVLAFCLRTQKKRAAWSLLLAIGFLVPFLIVAFSNFKQERYAYPGYVPLFVLAGLGMGLAWTLPIRASRLLVGFLLVPPLVKAAITHSLLPPEALPRLPLVQPGTPPADGRPWSLTEVVKTTEQRTAGNPIVFLGGSDSFHAAVLQFTSETQGSGRRWTGFSYQSHPNLKLSDLTTYIDMVNPAAVLYKSPPYYLMLGGFVPETLQYLLHSGYKKLELPYMQPDGSRFTLYLPPYPPVEILATTESAPQTAPPVRYSFGNRYQIMDVRFDKYKNQVMSSLTFARSGPPLKNEHIFYHLLDDKGQQIGQLDRAFCSGCQDPAHVASWVERFFIPYDLAARIRRIGIGIYAPPLHGPVPAQGGPTDWEGTRVLIDPQIQIP